MDYELLGFIKASKHRSSILKLLEDDIFTPTEISNKLNIQLSLVSKYLAELADKELVKVLNPDSRKGKIYSLTDEGKLYLDVIKR